MPRYVPPVGLFVCDRDGRGILFLADKPRRQLGPWKSVNIDHTLFIPHPPKLFGTLLSANNFNCEGNCQFQSSFLSESFQLLSALILIGASSHRLLIVIVIIIFLLLGKLLKFLQLRLHQTINQIKCITDISNAQSSTHPNRSRQDWTARKPRLSGSPKSGRMSETFS